MLKEPYPQKAPTISCYCRLSHLRSGHPKRPYKMYLHHLLLPVGLLFSIAIANPRPLSPSTINVVDPTNATASLNDYGLPPQQPDMRPFRVQWVHSSLPRIDPQRIIQELEHQRLFITRKAPHEPFAGYDYTRNNVHISFTPRVSRSAPHLAPMTNEEALKAMCDLLADLYSIVQQRSGEVGPISFACSLSSRPSAGVRLATGVMRAMT